MARYAHEIDLRINLIVQPLLIKCIYFVWIYDTGPVEIQFVERKQIHVQNCLYAGYLLYIQYILRDKFLIK